MLLHFRRAAAFAGHSLGRSKADVGVIAFPDLKVAYLPVAKVGNSTMKRTLKGLYDNPPDRLPEGLFSEWRARLGADWFVFAFVRNPYPRLASAYQNKVIERPVEVLPALQRMGVKRGDSLDRMLTLMERWPAELLDRHIMPLSTLLAEPLRMPNLKVFKLEEIGDAWPIIAAEIEQRGGRRLELAASENTTGAGNRAGGYYTRDLKRRVSEFYRSDFETFGYPIDV